MAWRTIQIAALLAVLGLLVTLAVDRLATGNALSEGKDRAESTLRQTVNALESHLHRFEALPALLARNDEVRRFLATAPAPADVAAMNVWLRDTNGLIEASDLYLIAPDGTTLAASNFDRPDSFVGQNFAYRPYFTEAAAGGMGRFFALGTTSGVRGYYFASPVRDGAGRITGVVALKIGVDETEAGWRTREYHTLVSDPEGVVFMSTRPDWLYKGLLSLTPDRIGRTETSRRYAGLPLVELEKAERTADGIRLLTLPSGNGGSAEFIEAATMPDAGWTVHLLLDTAPLRAQARLALVAFILLLGAGLSLGWAIWQRRARLAERIALQEQAKTTLERQVAERTADLRAANDELHRMQADLVQAGKLAALGRMSAALSHEINQPLAAARNYADSAAVLIDRGDLPRARENIGLIVSLIDRMVAIGRHLRDVARKPNEPLKACALGPVVSDALAIAATRLQASGVTVQVDLPDALPPVMGGPVRLQQVLVNLLSNAADAMDGQTGATIHLSAQAEGDGVILTVRDHGPGVAPAIADRIFDPFFTTKTVGSGLGLGLSISYNILKDFGGDLRVANHPEGGAVFTVLLRAAQARGLAAE